MRGEVTFAGDLGTSLAGESVLTGDWGFILECRGRSARYFEGSTLYSILFIFIFIFCNLLSVGGKEELGLISSFVIESVKELL